MQPVGDHVHIGIQVAMLVAQQQHRERRVVIDDDPAFAIEDFPARRQDRYLLDPVLFGKIGVMLVAGDLEPPKSVTEDQKNREDHVLNNRQPERGDFFLSAKHRSGSYSQSMHPGRRSPKSWEHVGMRLLYSIRSGRAPDESPTTRGFKDLNPHRLTASLLLPSVSGIGG